MHDEPEELTALLDQVPGWAGRRRNVRPLVGGITNRNWLVSVGDERFVVRSPGAGTDLLGIDRDHEYEAARQAAALGVGPEVVAFVDDSLVTRFIDGASTLTPEEARDPATLAAVAETLRTVHDAAPITAVFDWYAIPAAYAATARAHGVVVPAADDLAMAQAAELHRAFASAPDHPVPAHNDLLGANFLLDGDARIWIVDWEYAGMNDRFFDLGNFAVNNGLDDAGDEILLEGYFGELTNGRLARLRLMKVMSDLREAMWGVVQQAVSTLDVDFEAYAAEHFDRLLSNAGRPGWSRLLADAATGCGLDD
ncbi:MAG: phosphotransferase [Acidimicrobiales bacterium]|nr:phosphotransferase [Acidimicrobiales bacterium]